MEVNSPYIDPAQGSDYASSDALTMLYQPLVYPLANGSVRGEVADHWTVTPDALTWTFYLKHGIKFHDGTELNATDVKFTMDRLTTMGQGYAYLFVRYINATTVLDTYTVQFKLNQPFGPFLIALPRLYIVNADLVLAHIVKPGSYGDMGDYGNTWLLGYDAGSGLLKVKEFKQGTYLLMERFADFSGEHVQNVADKVTMYWNNEPSSVLTMMQRRELEISDIGQSNESLVALDNLLGVHLANFLPGYGFYLMMHTQKPPTDDVYFRKAIALSIDYDTMVKNVLPGSRPLAGPVSSVLPGHDPSIHALTQNMTAAMEALQQSKYYGNLSSYPVELHWCAEAAFEEKIADSAAASMQALGITVTIVKTPWLTMVGEMASKETAPNIELVQTAPSYFEAGSTLEARYSSSSLGTWEQNEWLQNATIDGMIADALRTVDQGERFLKYYAVQQQIVAMWPTVFLMDTGMTEAYQNNYIDFPLLHGIVLPMGYINDPRSISIYPEQIPK